MCRNISVPDQDRCNALVRRGHEVLVLDWSGQPEYVWDFPRNALYDLSVVSAGAGFIERAIGTCKLVARCRAARPELLLVYGYSDLALFFTALFMSLGNCRVVSMNDSKFDDYHRNWFGDLAKVIALMPYRGYLAATRRAADYLYYLTGRDSEVYHCAVDVDRIRRAAEPVWKATAFEQRYFLMVGRFVEKKNHLLLLDHFERYAASSARPRRLRLAGYGPLEPAIRARIESSETLRNLVTIDGYVSATDMPALLGGALALLLPSKQEQFGIVVTEALAAGVPAVVAPVAGAADLVDAHVNGYAIEPANTEGWVSAMQELDVNRQLWEHLSRNAEPRARRADVSVFTEAVERLGVS